MAIRGSRGMRRVLDFAITHGFEVARTARGHLKFSGCGVVVVTSGTPGDWRSIPNAISRLKRAQRERANHGR